MLTSLDGYVADSAGNFDWAEPDPEVHAAVNELERSAGTFLLGRRMYDVMVVWETMDVVGLPAVYREFAEIWHAADKVVFSRTLTKVSSARTRIEREFEPDAIRQLKAASAHDLSVGGPDLASQMFRAGLVDIVDLFLAPVVVGGGTPSLPRDLRLDLELVDERRFASGFVHVRYRVGKERG